MAPEGEHLVTLSIIMEDVTKRSDIKDKSLIAGIAYQPECIP